MFKNLFIADIKMMFRNRQAIFWAFMFPLIFSFIFGLFFGKNSTSGSLAVINRSNTEISNQYIDSLKDSGIFKISSNLSEEQAVSDIKKSKLIAAIIIPEGFGNLPEVGMIQAQMTQTQVQPTIAKQSLTIIIDPGNAQINGAVTGFTDRFLTALNMKTQGVEEIFTYETKKTNDRELNYYDFILAGILGLAVMNSSIIGISVAMSKYREDKILKRITTTPLPTWIFILGEVLSRLILNLLQILAILVVGIYVFSANIYGNIAVLVAVAIAGALLFQLMGFAVAALSKTTDAAQGMSTAVTIPMMFLAGVFFPIDSLPSWLAPIVSYLPLAPLLRILRAVALEGNSPFSDMKNVFIVLGWIAAMLALSIWKFRLTDE